MYASYENMYYTKILYLTAGKIRNDYNYIAHKKLISYTALTIYIHDKITTNSYIGCYDTMGRRLTMVFKYFINLYKNTENMFIIQNDLYTCDLPLGVYCEKHKKFIASDSDGLSLQQFYFRTDNNAEKITKLAKEFFYKSGDYCQCNNDMV